MIKKILISQPKPANGKSPYFDIANEYDVEFVFRPFVKVVGISSKEFRQQRIDISQYSAVVFTSKHAIDNFFKLAKELRVQVPETLKYFCTTEAIALYIQTYVQYRKRKVFFGQTGKVDDLLPSMIKHKDEKYLVPLSDVHNDAIKNLLDDNGLEHTECFMYRTVSNNFTDAEKAAFDYDMVVLFSPSGAKALEENFPELKGGKLKVASFGPATAKAVVAAGYELTLQAPTPKQPSMPGALKIYLRDLEEEDED